MQNQDTSTVKDRVQAIIDNHGLSKSEFARQLDINSSNFTTALKNNKVPRSTLVKINKTFGVSLDWLITGNGDMYEQKQPTTQIVHIQGNNSAASVNGDAYANANINQLEQLVDKIVVPKTEYFLMQQENEHLKSENARLFSIIDRILGENTKSNGEIINKILKGNE